MIVRDPLFGFSILFKEGLIFMTAILIYRFIHFAGLVLMFSGFGILITRAALTCDGLSGQTQRNWKKIGSILSGIGLFLVLLGGFGLLARMGFGFPGWAIAKSVIWISFSVLTYLVTKRPQASAKHLVIVILLSLLAIFFVETKLF